MKFKLFILTTFSILSFQANAMLRTIIQPIRAITAICKPIQFTRSFFNSKNNQLSNEELNERLAKLRQEADRQYKIQEIENLESKLKKRWTEKEWLEFILYFGSCSFGIYSGQQIWDKLSK